MIDEPPWAGTPGAPPVPGPAYQHTQKGPWCWLLFAIAAGCLSARAAVANDPVAAIVLPLAGWSMTLLGFAFQHLTVVDQGDRLTLRFGPLPLFKRSIRYEDMHDVTAGRLSVLDGWGIQWSLRGGWVWSIWGYDCVVLRHRRGTLRIGTNDAANLIEFLQDRLSLADQADRPPA
jgi:hypothetical protein